MHVEEANSYAVEVEVNRSGSGARLVVRLSGGACRIDRAACLKEGTASMVSLDTWLFWDRC
jgi:hypothetical protein